MTKTEIREMLLLIGDMRADVEFVLGNGNAEDSETVIKLYRHAIETCVDGFYSVINKPFEDQLKSNLEKVWGK